MKSKFLIFSLTLFFCGQQLAFGGDGAGTMPGIAQASGPLVQIGDISLQDLMTTDEVHDLVANWNSFVSYPAQDQVFEDLRFPYIPTREAVFIFNFTNNKLFQLSYDEFNSAYSFVRYAYYEYPVETFEAALFYEQLELSGIKALTFEEFELNNAPSW